MKLRKLLIIIFGLFFLSVVAVGLTSINHPIILKWVTGSAKHHGAPMPATVYTNGHMNNDIKVFYTDQPKNYLVSFPDYDSIGMIKFLNIDLNKKNIGFPLSNSKNDYDIVAGHLFQSKTGEHFSPFINDRKGSSFDLQLSFSGKQIKFNMPPNNLKLDSVRLLLP